MFKVGALMEFAREAYSAELVDEMRPLWKSHHAEIANEHYGPLDPDLAVYQSADSAGSLRIYTVRNGAKSLHGYQIMFVSRHLRSKERIIATQDILYLCPEARQGSMAYRFIQWCCEELRKERVEVVHQVISARHDFGRLLERMDYRLEDLVYARRLDRPLMQGRN